MANIKVAVINEASPNVVTDKQVEAVVPALQTQVRSHLAPAWGVDADLIFVPKGHQPPAGAWWLSVLDDSIQADVLGYHDLTSEGLPLGKVFARTDQQLGLQWTVTASHELLEMLIDPDINLTAFVQPTPTEGKLYAYEVCDACEADEYGYTIGTVLVSDFVYPAWFELLPTSTGTKQYDYRNKISQPFQLLPGGYIGVFDVFAGSGWQQMMAQGAPLRYSMRPHVGSRRERRRTPRNQWLKSNQVGAAPKQEALQV